MKATLQHPIRVLVVCALCLCSWVACADTTVTIHVNRSDTTFDVILSSNPSTGYSWRITQYDESLLKMISEHFMTTQTKRVGASGKVYFTFQLQQGQSYPDSTTILFQYARPWEPSSGDLTKVIVKFDS